VAEHRTGPDRGGNEVGGARAAEVDLLVELVL
jgi:hypothetical protein